MPTLFISDLHLCKDRPLISELFLAFLEKQKHIRALYILGDLFEVWIGDDSVSDEDQAILSGLKKLTQCGVPVYLMHGNRDFLLGDQFSKQTGCQLIPDPSIIDLYGIPTLLMHGDTLCTDDVDYQKFREMVRNTQWQAEFLSMPIEQRLKIASSYRNESQVQTKNKSPEITDANQQAVETAMRHYSLHKLIHGHTHRPDTHLFSLDGSDAQRVVLGDWYEHGSVLVVDKNGYDLTTI